MASAEVRSAWTTALQVGDSSTIVSVFPNSPAESSDLRVGDTIVTANGVRWGQSPAEQAAFNVELTKGALEPKLHLTIRREGREMATNLTGQDACKASVTLIADRHINASSSGNNIFVNSGLENLLPNDDELAFIIAHEIAHIILGHSKLSRDALKVHDRRLAMEVAADTLGLRLMLRAGYAPESAASANAKIAHAARGSISKLLNLHGPYMAPKDRSTFLAQQAAQAGSENTLQ
ncbi:MAG: hypothetical protein CGW95_12020 [Phenylobacterium zucineum]|nr:MAG: hypothetical protein CGW95_12020 [Phenylobacterium zucineum]